MQLFFVVLTFDSIYFYCNKNTIYFHHTTLIPINYVYHIKDR